MLNIGIDASNIISGGGLTHLVEILKELEPNEVGLESVEVWAPDATLSHISPKPGIRLKHHSWLNDGLLKRNFWQKYILSGYAKKEYDLLYVPGGSYVGNFRPFVTMNRNLQPFDKETIDRYEFSLQKLRIIALSKIQAYTYRKAMGVIFLSNEAMKVTLKNTNLIIDNTSIIPHGIASKFYKEPREQKSIRFYTRENPYRLLYVSTVNLYKHQWEVIEAVFKLRKKGYPVVLDLIGSVKNSQSEKLLNEAIEKYDPDKNFVFFHGSMNQDDLLRFYHSTNAAVFASSCETFGQILLESMASGLPIACADRSAMPEILEDAGVYFDPENSEGIAKALEEMLNSKDMRAGYAKKAYDLAKNYSWHRCSRETFKYLYNMHNQYKLANTQIS